MTFYQDLTSKYHGYIPGFFSNIRGYSRTAEYYSVNIDGADLDINLANIKSKLRMFKATGYQIDIKKKDTVTPSTVINNTNSNNNENNMSNQNSLATVVTTVREKIGEMTSLGQSDYDEIMKKIDLIENVLSGSDNKREKWSKLKSVVTWLAEKGVDVAITILPLLLQIK